MARAVLRRGGRPSRQDALRLKDKILDVATALFLAEGYGATSIDRVAADARISKRTFYHRFKDKAALFEAVVRRLIERWRAPVDSALVASGTLEEVLRRTARQALAAALSPEALALRRVILAEAPRFPNLARVVNDAGARQGVARIAEMMEQAIWAGQLRIADSQFAAEQFLSLVISIPQRRALGFGNAMNAADLDRWIERCIELFLHGARGYRLDH